MNTDFKTNIYRSKYVILKLLSFQQNDNELTVPSPKTWLVTQFIEPNVFPKKQSLPKQQLIGLSSTSAHTDW